MNQVGYYQSAGITIVVYKLHNNCCLGIFYLHFSSQAIESLNSQLSKWLEACADVKGLPESTVELLGQVISEDTLSVYSIPEPPTMPAMQPVSI